MHLILKLKYNNRGPNEKKRKIESNYYRWLRFHFHKVKLSQYNRYASEIINDYLTLSFGQVDLIAIVRLIRGRLKYKTQTVHLKFSLSTRSWECHRRIARDYTELFRQILSIEN